jgi:hypothetical protein
MLEDEWAPSLSVFTASWRHLRSCREPGVSSQTTVTPITVLARFVQHAIGHQSLSFADGQCWQSKPDRLSHKHRGQQHQPIICRACCLFPLKSIPSQGFIHRH